jgi:hypothetical protein
MALKKFLKIIESAYFFVAALAMYCWVNLMVDEVGRKFQGIVKILPLLLFLSGVVLLLFALHLLIHPLNAKKMVTTALGNGLALALLELRRDSLDHDRSFEWHVFLLPFRLWLRPPIRSMPIWVPSCF